MKKNPYITVAEYSLEELFPFIPDDDSSSVREVFEGYSVKMSSQRLITFKHNHMCVCCGIPGTKMLLQMSGGSQHQAPHFNMYADTVCGTLMLMTKDHIIPRSEGGKDVLSNYQTMCAECNEFKGSMNIAIPQLKHVKSIWYASIPEKDKILNIISYLNENDIVPKGNRIKSLIDKAQKWQE